MNSIVSQKTPRNKMATTNCIKNDTSAINLNLHSWWFGVAVALGVFMGQGSSRKLSENLFLVLGVSSKM